LVQQEGRIALALEALKQGYFTSARAAAKAYDVPKSTFQNRANGIPMQLQHRPPNCKLSIVEETTLVQWILSMDQRGLSLRPDSVQQIANLLLEKRSNSSPCSTVSKL
jgi:helix-turn-helix, Psq domain